MLGLVYGLMLPLARAAFNLSGINGAASANISKGATRHYHQEGGEAQIFVAQSCTLPYRRVALGRAPLLTIRVKLAKPIGLHPNHTKGVEDISPGSPDSERATPGAQSIHHLTLALPVPP